MKKVTWSFIISILFSSIGFGQIKSGKITYKLEYQRNIEQYIDSMDTEYEDIKQFERKYMMNKKKSAPYISYSLVFNSQEASFKTEPIMANDNGLDIERTASSATGNGGVFYTDLIENIGLQQFESMGEELLVRTNLENLQWTVGKETKVIQGYTCRKATAIVNINAVSKGTVTAWFAPELPFQFGPIGLSGLPGMILGLKRRQYYFYADKIKLSPKKRAIERPTKGRLVTANEFYSGIRKMAKEMRNGR